jgi:hypothetical protein
MDGGGATGVGLLTRRDTRSHSTGRVGSRPRPPGYGGWASVARVSNLDSEFDSDTPPSGAGCAECVEDGGWWVHLRRCAACGHVGCCDSSPAQHATAHFRGTGHRVVQSFEPGEDWFWDYRDGTGVRGPSLAPPTSRPADQPSPGPAGSVPSNWRELIH